MPPRIDAEAGNDDSGEYLKLSDAQEHQREQLRLIRITNRLTLAFATWAIVVLIVGTVGLLYMQAIRGEQVEGERRVHEMEQRVALDERQQDLLNERQQYVLRWIEARERMGEDRDGPRAQR